MHLTMPSPGEKGQWRLIAAAACFSAVLALLATLLAVGYVRQKELQKAAEKESLRAHQAAIEARNAANRRLRARDQAEELVGFLLDDLRDELLQLNRSDLLGAAAEKAVTYFDQLPPELVTPESESRLASILITLSDARYQQGNERGAIAAATRSIEIWKRLAAAGDPDGNYTVRLGRALGELGLYQNQSKDSYGAAATYREILRLHENPPPGLKDDGWRDHGLAKAHLGLGEIERLKKNYSDARAEYAQAVAHITRALTHNSNEVSWLQMSMTLHNNAGVTFMHDKNYPAAEASFQRAVEPNRTLIRIEPKNRRWEKELATTLLNLGALMHLQKDYVRAGPFLQEAVTLREGIADWDPKSARSIRKLAHAWHRLAVLQFDTGRNADAVASARSSLDALRRLLNTDPGDREAIGEIQEYTGKYHDRLVAAGMAKAAKEMIEETTAFAEANRAGKAGPAAWDKLLASLRETATGPGTNRQPDL
jgi:tetratricopeptide (TPR) repeat protein